MRSFASCEPLGRMMRRVDEAGRVRRVAHRARTFGRAQLQMLKRAAVLGELLIGAMAFGVIGDVGNVLSAGAGVARRGNE